MKISGEKEGTALVVHMKGRLDAVGSTEFEQKCLEFVDRGETRIVLNFKEIDYISTMGLRSLLVLGKRLKSDGGSLLLCSMNHVVADVFEKSGFSTILPIYESVEQAIEKL